MVDGFQLYWFDYYAHRENPKRKYKKNKRTTKTMKGKKMKIEERLL